MLEKATSVREAITAIEASTDTPELIRIPEDTTRRRAAP
jgi:hypothetical protein